MKLLFIFLFGSLLLSCSESKDSQKVSNTSLVQDSVSESSHDTAYIAGLNTNDYGMYTYVIVLLKQGPNWGHDSAEATRLQHAHMDNIAAWERKKLLAVAEPMYNDTSELQGIYVFELDNVAEVNKLVSLDPAVQAGKFVAESLIWENSTPVKDVDFILQMIAMENK